MLGLVACALIPYRVWQKCAWPILWLAVAGLLAVLLPWTRSIAPEINGARRWLNVGITIQPSDIAKIAVIVWTAAIGVKKADSFRSLRRGLGPFLVVWFLLMALVVLEPDLSTAMVIGALGALIVFTAGARLSHFAFLGLVSAPLIWRQLTVGFRAARIEAFLNPAGDPTGAGFQVHQSLVALGSGGSTASASEKGARSSASCRRPTTTSSSR